MVEPLLPSKDVQAGFIDDHVSRDVEEENRRRLAVGLGVGFGAGGVVALSAAGGVTICKG